MDWPVYILVLATLGQPVDRPRGLRADPWAPPGAAPWLCRATETTVRSHHVVITWAWRDDGALLEQRFRLVDAEAAHAALVYEHDADGRRVREELRRPAEGDAVARVTTWAWDDAGRMVREEVDQPPDGVIDDRRTWTYDAAGRLVEEVWDRPAGGIVIERLVHTHDAAGRRVTTDHFDRADGDPTARTTYTYGADDRLARAERDHGPDGSIDTVTTYAWDDAGRPLSEETDEGVDGTVDRRHVWQYDEAGRVVREETTSGPDDPGRVTTSTWDERGRLVREETDRDGDGAPDVWRDTVAWDAADRPLRADERMPDRRSTEVWRWTRDGEGLPWREERTVAADGYRDVVTWGRDHRGAIVERCADGGGDGYAERHETWTWDPSRQRTIWTAYDVAGEDPQRDRAEVERAHGQSGPPTAVEVDDWTDGVNVRGWSLAWSGEGSAAPAATLEDQSLDGRAVAYETERDAAGRARARVGRDDAGVAVERVEWDARGRVVRVDLADTAVTPDPWPGSRRVTWDEADRATAWEWRSNDGRLLERWTCDWEEGPDGRATRSTCRDLTGVRFDTTYEWGGCAEAPPPFACRVARPPAPDGDGGGCAMGGRPAPPAALLVLGGLLAVVALRRRGALVTTAARVRGPRQYGIDTKNDGLVASRAPLVQRAGSNGSSAGQPTP